MKSARAFLADGVSFDMHLNFCLFGYSYLALPAGEPCGICRSHLVDHPLAMWLSVDHLVTVSHQPYGCLSNGHLTVRSLHCTSSHLAASVAIWLLIYLAIWPLIYQSCDF